MLKKILKSNSLLVPIMKYQNNKVLNSLYQILNRTNQLIHCKDIYKFSTKKTSKIKDRQINHDEKISGEKISDLKTRRTMIGNDSFPKLLNKLNKKSINKGIFPLLLI